jgi:predicted nuclease with TOPRIM domain
MAANKRVSNARKGATSRPVKSGKSAKPGQSAKMAKSAKPPAPGRIAQLEAMVHKLRASLVAEAQRRKLDQRVLSEVKRARDGMAKQLSALRAQGLKLAAQIKRAAQENQTVEQARRAALAKVEELRTELHDKSEEVRRTSAELAKLTRESATRAREIVHGRGLGLEPHHDPEIEGLHDDDPFADDPFSGEKPPI